MPKLLTHAKKLPLYWRTLRRLKPVQVYGRLFAKVKRYSRVHAPRQAVLRPDAQDIRTDFLPSHVSSDGRTFTFLNEPVEFRSKVDWHITSKSMLWRYNLHYFEYLASLSLRQGRDLMEDWITNNRNPRSLGWDPYPLSMRLVHWFKWLSRHGEGNASSVILQSLYVQSGYLARNFEFHIQANHLFENAKALLWAGLVFDGPGPERWLKQGQDILLEELEEQILADGAHYELSPMYHSLILEGCLDLLNLGTLQTRAPNVHRAILQRVPKMLEWLQAMCHPDGEISLFNDAAFGIAPTPRALFTYAERLGLSVRQERPSCHLEASGYVVVGDSHRGDYLILDVGGMGPVYQPGHGHCDTLSFELSLAGRRVLVDTGVYAYQDPAMRRMNRETSAHNTLRIDGLDQSEIWGSFRVANRAEPRDVHVDLQPESGFVRAGHSGYESLGVHHFRQWNWSPGSLVVTDQLEGSGKHRAELFFHLYPDLRWEVSGPLAILSAKDCEVARIWLPEGWTPRVVPSLYCPEFGRAIPNQTLELSTTVTLPAHISSRIEWTVD
ncbi:MAG: alginate lyase family protein [Acidobacteria bacterium]|nr:alginate lyase family protein [Acidobacteriota bacterium]